MASVNLPRLLYLRSYIYFDPIEDKGYQGTFLNRNLLSLTVISFLLTSSIPNLKYGLHVGCVGALPFSMPTEN